MAMFGALAAVLMIFEVPLPFIAPSFYGMDISEVPVLVVRGACGGCYALGLKSGEADAKPALREFGGCQFLLWMPLVLPAGIIYRKP